MPSGAVEKAWETKRLSDIVSIRNEKVLPSNVTHDTFCVELNHIETGTGRLVGWSDAERSTSSKYRFVAGDVLFGRLRSYLRKYWHADREGICTTELWPLMVKPEHVDSRFLHAIVQSYPFNALANLAYGTHMPRADWEVVGNLRINIPPIPEQRAIAEVLSDIDKLLGALIALIAKKQSVKQAAMQQLVSGNTRLPGFGKEWQINEVRSIGFLYGGLIGKAKGDFGQGNARYVTFLSILQDTILDTKHTDYVHVAPTESQNAVMKGDLLFNGTSETPDEIAISAVMGTQIEHLYLNSFCFGLRIRDKRQYDPLFLAYLFRSPTGRRILKALAQGATRYNMSKSQFLKLHLSVPSLSEQQAIARVLSDMDAEISALERRRDKIRDVKQGMLQQLLSGRIRLAKPE